jgi:hypothetical protein
MRRAFKHPLASNAQMLGDLAAGECRIGSGVELALVFLSQFLFQALLPSHPSQSQLTIASNTGQEDWNARLCCSVSCTISADS